MDGSTFRPIHRTRTLFNSSLSHTQRQEMEANHDDWTLWLAKANALKNFVTAFSYATVLKRGKKVVQTKVTNTQANHRFGNKYGNFVIQKFDQKIKDKRFICKPKKGHINASVVPQASNYPIALLNRFDVLQHDEAEVQAHELENNVVTPATTNTSSFKGIKNGNGPNWAMVAATGGSYNTHMGHFNKTFKDNKNKTGQTLGKLNSCDDNSCTNTHKSVQHEINGQQHTSLQFLGNKNGIGSKLGSMLSSVYTEGDTVKNDYASSVKELHHCHGKLSFRGNKNGNGQTLGPMAFLDIDQSSGGPQRTYDQLSLPDPNTDQPQQMPAYTSCRQIPSHVFKNRFQSLDYKNCLYQNDKLFGFVPLNDLMVYTGPEVVWGSIPDIVEAHRKIRNSGIPNFMGMRIPVQIQLKITAWRKYLHHYWDNQLLDLIEFGFPLDFDRNVQLTATEVNHHSTLQYHDHVSRYIQDEIEHKAIVGPFQQPPFPCHISPFLTRDKPNP